MKTEIFKYIVDAIRERAPGPGNLWFTVSKISMLDIEWNALVGPPIEQFICDEVGAVTQFDEGGNYQFQLTKESVRNRTRNEIRKLIRYEGPVIFDEKSAIEHTLDRIMEVIEREGR